MKQVEYNQPTSSPTAKVAAAGIAGLVVTAIVGILNAFGIVIPAEVTGAALTAVSALTTLVTFLAGYLKKDKKPVAAVAALSTTKRGAK